MLFTPTPSSSGLFLKSQPGPNQLSVEGCDTGRRPTDAADPPTSASSDSFFTLNESQ